MRKQPAQTKSKIINWIDARFPLIALWESQVSKYYAPKNFNFWYYFGSLALLVLVIQIVSGIFLVMNFKPDGNLNADGLPVAFASVEYIMRDVSGGWFIRYMHSTGASFFFIVVYLHMFRGLIYGSFKKPRELVWIFGALIFLCLMAEAFMGYLLPWGQMSFWGAQVIINLFSAIPVIGPDLSVWIRGDFNVSDATLNRFFSLHVIAIPLILLCLIVAHLIALHEVGSNNPDGIEIHDNEDANGVPVDGIPFHPYYTVKDILGVVVFLIVFCSVLFFAPEGGGMQRAGFAVRRAVWHTDRRAQLHECLCQGAALCSGRVRIHMPQLLPDILPHGGVICAAAVAQKPRIYAQNIAVHGGLRKVKANGADCAGGIVPDAGK